MAGQPGENSPSTQGKNKIKLSLVISSRNDPVGCLITIRSAMEEFKSCDFDCEIIIVDNSDIKEKQNIFIDLSKPFINSGEIKLIIQPFSCLFSARDRGVDEASGEYILVVDSHCIFYKNSINNLVTFADKCENLGVLFGIMCYSKAHEKDAFCDRDVESFLPIRLCSYNGGSEAFEIPLRSMPYLIRRELYRKMKGYSPLSTNKLVWGGGDFLISFKSLLLGHRNLILTTAGVVHLGPFNDGGFFTKSFTTTASQTYPRFIGMLAAAYVVGGKDLLYKRRNQIANRIKDEPLLTRMLQKAIEFGVGDRRWIKENLTTSYNDIVAKFKGNQASNLTRTYDIENFWPKGKKITDPIYEISNYIPKLDDQQTIDDSKDDWRSRIIKNQDRLKNKQSIGAPKCPETNSFVIS